MRIIKDTGIMEQSAYFKYDYRNKETDNSRNGHSQKTMYTSYGDMNVSIPRDRDGDYEPQLVKKYQNTVTQDMEEKILSMYAKEMTTYDIESHMKELYDIDISDSAISRITDKIPPIVKEWRERSICYQKRHCVLVKLKKTSTCHRSQFDKGPSCSAALDRGAGAKASPVRLRISGSHALTNFLVSSRIIS